MIVQILASLPATCILLTTIFSDAMITPFLQCTPKIVLLTKFN